MASLPDDQCTKAIEFAYEEVDATSVSVSITPSDRTMAFRRGVQKAIGNGRPQRSIDYLRHLETLSVQDDIDEAWRSIHNSRATTNAAQYRSTSHPTQPPRESLRRHR